MKQHIVGFILFNSIVVTSVFVAALFYSVPGVDSVRAPETPNNYVKTSCWKSKNKYTIQQNSVKVTQAVFDGKTQELKTELFVHSNEQSLNNIEVALHFFVKDGNSTRYLATEDLTNEKGDMKGVYDMSEGRITKATYIVTSDYKWLGDLKSRENLYVVPETINAEMYRDYTPIFNQANATPVTLAR